MKEKRAIKRPEISKMMMGRKHRLGKKLTEEAKEIRRAKMRERHTLKSSRRIAIIDTQTGIKYESILQASKALSISIASMVRAITLNKRMRNGKYFIRADSEAANEFPIGF